MRRHPPSFSKLTIFTPLLTALLFIVACGGGADKPVEGPGSQPAAQIEATTAPGQDLQDTPAAQLTAPTPTPPAVVAPAATAQARATPTPIASETVYPGKIDVLIGGFNNERFIARYCAGLCHQWGRLLHGYVATTTHEGGVIPEVVERWEINGDGTVWKLWMREGIKFHNGEDATIEDLHFSLVRMIDQIEDPERTTGTQATEFRVIKSQEITGPMEITATMHEPYAGYAVWRSNGHAGNLRMNLYPEKLLGPPFKENEEAYEKAPVGAGPMSMTSRNPGQTMSFERFDEYFYTPDFGAPEDRRPRFQFLDLHNVPELATRVAALRAGNGDLVEAAESVKDQIEGAGGRLIYAQESTYVAMAFNRCWSGDTRCSDIRVRQALDFAIPKQTIVDTLYSPRSYALNGWTFVTPTSIGWTPKLVARPFEPDKARKLMESAGYNVPGFTGGKDYGKLELLTWNPGDIPFIPDMAGLVAESWREELGLDVKVSVIDRTLLGQRSRGGELVDKIVLFINECRWDGSTITHGTYNDPESPGRASNDPKLWDLIGRTWLVVDPDKRGDAMAAMYPAVREESYQISLGYGNLPWGASKRIKAWEPWSAAAFFNAHWTIEVSD